jgi:PAT family beta-lactamase induction signal transducer AmpG
MCVVMLTAAALGGLMAQGVPERLKGRVSSFYQGGSLGWGALGGGGMLMLAQHMARGPLGLLTSAAIALPGLLALTIAEPPVMRHPGGFGEVMAKIGHEIKTTFWRWSALPVLLLLCSPMGSGAAQGLLPSIAVEYGVSGDSVAWMNGVAGGLLTAAGALLIGFAKMPDDIRPAYCWAGLANALSLGILCLGHPRPSIYFASVALYLLTVGACYALFTGLVLKLLGVSGKSGSTRYAIAVSLGNAPVAYMAKVDGWGYGRFGLRGLPGIDMAVSGGVAVCFLAWLWRPKKNATASFPSTGSHPLQ